MIISTPILNARFDPKARADAEAVKNDLNYNNYMEVGASTFADNMTGSFSGFIGIGQSNQAAGQMNNQGNVAAVAFVSDNDAYASSLAAVGVSNKNNEYNANHKKRQSWLSRGLVDSQQHPDPDRHHD